MTEESPDEHMVSHEKMKSSGTGEDKKRHESKQSLLKYITMSIKNKEEQMNCKYGTCDLWYGFCNKKGYQYPCTSQGILWDISTHARVRVRVLNSSKVIHVNVGVIPTYIWHMMILLHTKEPTKGFLK